MKEPLPMLYQAHVLHPAHDQFRMGDDISFCKQFNLKNAIAMVKLQAVPVFFFPFHHFLIFSSANKSTTLGAPGRAVY